MSLETFSARQKAELIYSLYFDPESEHCIDFSLFDTLHFFGAITNDEFEQLTEMFEKAGQNLYEQINKFDKNELHKNNKGNT